MSERKLLFMMTTEQAEAFARLVEAAGRGDGDAACRLADRYREGLDGLRYSPKQAFHWYSRSALAGDAWGQNNLGACYEHGVGCAQSYAKAVKWYRRAVAQGNATAYMNLGYCFLRGHGVPGDKAEALRLFREAVARGEDRAAQEVERLERETGSRVLQPIPAGTPSTRPWGLALGVPPRDGPPEQLQRPETASDELCGTADTRGTIDSDRAKQPERFGLVGASCAPSPNPRPEDAGGIPSAADSTRSAGTGGPVEDRLEAGAESEHPGTDSLRVRGGTLRCPQAARLGRAREPLSEESTFRMDAQEGREPEEFDEETAARYRAFLAAKGITPEDLLRRRKWIDLERRAWEKDDCFELPDPASPEGVVLRREVDEFLAKYDAERSRGSPRRDRPEIVYETPPERTIGVGGVGGVGPAREPASAGKGEASEVESLPIVAERPASGVREGGAVPGSLAPKKGPT